MQKAFISLLLLTGLSGAAQAQRNVSLGLKAGPSLSRFVGATTAEDALGFHAGAFLNVGLSKLVAFQPEVLYTQKGGTYKFTSGEAKERLNYLDIPLVFHLNIDGVFFEAGPQVGFLLSASRIDGSASYSIKPAYNTIDAGYVLGLGYQRKTGLGVGLRYNGGFTSIDKAYQLGTATIQRDIRNSAFQLYLTYSFQGN